MAAAGVEQRTSWRGPMKKLGFLMVCLCVALIGFCNVELRAQERGDSQSEGRARTKPRA